MRLRSCEDHERAAHFLTALSFVLPIALASLSPFCLWPSRRIFLIASSLSSVSKSAYSWDLEAEVHCPCVPVSLWKTSNVPTKETRAIWLSAERDEVVMHGIRSEGEYQTGGEGGRQYRITGCVVTCIEYTPSLCDKRQCQGRSIVSIQLDRGNQQSKYGRQAKLTILVLNPLLVCL